MSGSARISPTAHYTGHVWVRNGLAPSGLATATGRLFYRALAPPMWLASLAPDGTTLERMLLQRHRLIDTLVRDEIQHHGATVVVELAGGLSARALRLSASHPEVAFHEGDLPGMAALKRDRLAAIGDGPTVHDVDVLATSGPTSLEALFDRVVPADASVVVITEGLVNYFRTPDAERLWASLAALARRQPRLTYLFDLHVEADLAHRPASRAFRRFLQVFARGAIDLHAANEADALARLRTLGWSEASAARPSDWRDRFSPPLPDGPDLFRIVVATGGTRPLATCTTSPH